MKKFLLFSSLFVLFASFSVAQSMQSNPKATEVAGLNKVAPIAPKAPSNVQLTSDVNVAYAVFDGHALFLEVDAKSQSASLKVRYTTTDYIIHGDKASSFLKQEVARLTQPGKSTSLGNTGYTFTYADSATVNVPYIESGPNFTYVCIRFAGKTVVDGKNIRAGNTTKPAESTAKHSKK